MRLLLNVLYRFWPLFLIVILLPSSALAQPLSTQNPFSYSEQDYGRRVLADLSSKYAVNNSHPLHEGVTRIVNRLSKKSESPSPTWQVHILEAPSIRNVSATRGNYVFVWSGLFDLVNSEGELIAILAHAMAHVFAGHTDPDPSIESQKMLIQTGRAIGRLSLGRYRGARVLSDGAATIAEAMTHRQKRRSKGYYYYPEDYEFEADKRSLSLVTKAGLDPKEVLFFWMRVRNDRAFEESVQFFKRHKLYPERAKKIGAMIPESSGNTP